MIVKLAGFPRNTSRFLKTVAELSGMPTLVHAGVAPVRELASREAKAKVRTVAEKLRKAIKHESTSVMSHTPEQSEYFHTMIPEATRKAAKTFAHDRKWNML